MAELQTLTSHEKDLGGGFVVRRGRYTGAIASFEKEDRRSRGDLMS